MSKCYIIRRIAYSTASGHRGRAQAMGRSAPPCLRSRSSGLSAMCRHHARGRLHHTASHHRAHPRASTVHHVPTEAPPARRGAALRSDGRIANEDLEARLHHHVDARAHFGGQARDPPRAADEGIRCEQVASAPAPVRCLVATVAVTPVRYESSDEQPPRPATSFSSPRSHPRAVRGCRGAGMQRHSHPARQSTTSSRARIPSCRAPCRMSWLQASAPSRGATAWNPCGCSDRAPPAGHGRIATSIS